MGETDCRCDNIAINNPEKETFLGGPQCDEDEYGDPYCYVSEDSHCEDMEERGFATGKVETSNIWYRGKIYKSLEACENIADQPSTGSEEIIYDVEITGNDNLVDNEDGEIIKFDFTEKAYKDWLNSERFKTNYTLWKNDKDLKTTRNDSYLHCEYQCARRNKNETHCGAWSFDKDNQICYIHNVEACCGQLDKQKANPDFVSGYICPNCWSTRNDCP